MFLKSALAGLREGVCEFRLLAEGLPYVSRAGQIRINPNPAPSTAAAIQDVYVRAATHPVVTGAAEVCQSIAATQPCEVEEVTLQVGVRTAQKLIEGARKFFRV